MNDKEAFAPAGEFIKHKFQTQDTLSLQWKTLALYQQVLRLHSTDANADARIDADLHRLEFVNKYSVLPDKKQLYDRALQHIEEKYADNPLSAMASFNRVLLMLDQGNNIPRYGKAVAMQQKDKVDYVAIKNKLEAIIKKHPGSEGAIRAEQTLESVLGKFLQVQVDEVVLPGEASKFLLRYKNIPEVSIKIVAFEWDEYENLIGRRGDWVKKLLSFRAVQSFTIALPATADMDEHSTEIKLDALPPGYYAIIVSDSKYFDRKNNPMSYALFQSSALSILTRSSGLGYVLNRKTGEPVSDATITLYNRVYNGKSGVYKTTEAGSVKTSADGSFEITKYNNGRGYTSARVTYREDVLRLNGHLDVYKNDVQHHPHTRTFFFTDRSIYRPGQEIFFKGIMVNIEEGGKKNNVVANQETEVTFYDVNGQRINSLKLKTNTFGSFTGSFKAPEGVLTGAMRISNGSGNAYVSVEEYKRPKFAVAFDTLKETYTLNEPIKLTGKAQAYAGNAIDNAVVKYRVVRRARWPFWWSYYRWGMPSSPEQEIAQGTAETKADGSFEIVFTAIPDLSVDKESLPVFNYTVYADVTDINGETRSATQSVSVGYVSMVINADVPEKARPADLDTLIISTSNLNNNFVSASLHIRISKLAEPSVVYRKRLWEMPDQFIMDSVSFRNSFPADEYRNETDHTTWPLANTVFEKNIRTTREGIVAIPAGTWQQNGWYVVELETKDKNGKPIVEKKYVQVWDRNNKGNINDPLLVVPAQQTKEPGHQP